MTPEPRRSRTRTPGTPDPYRELDDKTLEAARAGLDKGYVVTQVEHNAATQTAGQKFFAGVVNRISQ